MQFQSRWAEKLVVYAFEWKRKHFHGISNGKNAMKVSEIEITKRKKSDVRWPECIQLKICGLKNETNRMVIFMFKWNASYFVWWFKVLGTNHRNEIFIHAIHLLLKRNNRWYFDWFLFFFQEFFTFFQNQIKFTFWAKHHYFECFLHLFCFFQGTKGAPYYVGAAQTLPRGMYSDRNKNIIGKFKALFIYPFENWDDVYSRNYSLFFDWNLRIDVVFIFCSIWDFLWWISSEFTFEIARIPINNSKFVHFNCKFQLFCDSCLWLKAYIWVFGSHSLHWFSIFFFWYMICWLARLKCICFSSMNALCGVCNVVHCCILYVCVCM